MSDIFEKFEAQLEAGNQAFADAVEALSSSTKNTLISIASELMDQYPEVTSISWHQFTPYFNDGAPCEFTVYDDTESIFVNGEPTYDCFEFVAHEYKAVSSPEVDRQRGEAAIVFAKVLRHTDHEMLKRIFGDHAELTIQRDGVYITEYDHE